MASEPGHAEAPLLRLHSLSWLFLIGSQIRTLLLPAIVFIFAGEGSPFRLLLLLFLIPATIQPLFVYFSYRYQLRADEMVVRQGVLFRNERRIPYSRIQNVDLVQNPLHRLARVAVVRLETASGGKPEAVMRVLSLQAIEQLRHTVGSDPRAASAEMPGTASDQDQGQQSKAPAGQDAEATLLRLRPLELVKLGLISNQGMVVVAAAAAFFFQQNAIDWSEVDWEDIAWLERVPGGAWVRDTVLELVARWTADRSDWLTGLLLVAAGAFALLGALYLFSIGLAFLRFFGFTLRRQGNYLRAEFGLLTRVAQTTPRQRIQHLLIHRGPLHRLFRRVSIRIDTAGGGGTGDPWQSGGSGGASRQWLAPLIPGAKAGELADQALPEVELVRIEGERSRWLPIAQRAWKRRFRARAIFLLVLGVALSFFSLWALVIPALGLPLQLLLARKFVSSRRYRCTDQAIFWQSGWWSRDLSIVRFGKIQAVRLARSPLDRRHRMAAVLIDTAGARPGSHAVFIPYLDLEVARELCQRLHRETSGRAFVWN